MPFDPATPAPGSPLNAAEMRGQLNALFAFAQIHAFEDDCVNRNPAGHAPLALAVSDLPTQAEVLAVTDHWMNCSAYCSGRSGRDPEREIFLDTINQRTHS